MITVRDIDNKRFEQARPGYKPEEVDDFLREISESFKQLIREKEEADQKMGVLVEAVKKYKTDEDAIKDSLIIAQKQAREIIQEAQSRAEQIIAEANLKSDEIIGSAGIRLKREEAGYVKLKKEVDEFRTSLLNMYKDHLNLINDIPELDEDENDTDDGYESSDYQGDVAPIINDDNTFSADDPREDVITD